jgi:hypothetical protein
VGDLSSRQTARNQSPAPQFHAFPPVMRCAFEIASAARIGVYDCLHVTLAGV